MGAHAFLYVHTDRTASHTAGATSGTTTAFLFWPHAFPPARTPQFPSRCGPGREGAHVSWEQRALGANVVARTDPATNHIWRRGPARPCDRSLRGPPQSICACPNRATRPWVPMRESNNRIQAHKTTEFRPGQESAPDKRMRARRNLGATERLGAHTTRPCCAWISIARLQWRVPLSMQQD